MQLRIGNKKIDKYQEVSVSLRYDSVASTFSFDLYFDPNDQVHKEAFKPGEYKEVTIEQDGELLITGTLLSNTFTSSAKPHLKNVNGYSKTGVLADSDIPKSCYPLQSNNINLKNIAEKILKPFGLKLVVDSSVSGKTGSNYKNTTGGDTQTCAAYLSELANQKHVILTHNEKGELVLTEAKANDKPVYAIDATTGNIQPITKMVLSFDGQKMHSDISVQRQASKKNNAGKADVTNPYCEKTYRPRNVRQSSGDDSNTDMAAKNLLSEELKGVKLNIEMTGWTLDGKIVRPNSTITVKDPSLYLYNTTTWFIESVEYKGTESAQTAVLTCYPPETYNGKQPKNIFS